MLVSDSLSFGMRDALEQGIADKVTFVTACKFTHEQELEEIIAQYLKVYWVKCPEAGEATRKAWREGRIIVPRATGIYCAPIGHSGNAIHASFEDWRSAVAEHAPDWSMGWCHRSFKGRITVEQVLATQSIEELYKLFKKPTTDDWD